MSATNGLDCLLNIRASSRKKWTTLWNPAQKRFLSGIGRNGFKAMLPKNQALFREMGEKRAAVTVIEPRF